MEPRDVTALVTGGASGLGWATARALADRGANVAILDLPSTAGEGRATELGQRGLWAPADVTDAAAVSEALDLVGERFGVPRVIVNCAGVGRPERVLGREGPHDLDRFRRVIEINVVGTFNVLRLAAERTATLDPLGPDGERGVIVNTASIAAFDGQIGQAAYSASKGGIVSMTLPIARDLASRGIRCVAIAPGTFDTPLLGTLSEEVRDELARGIPFPSRLGHPDDFAALVIHVVSNRYLNGEAIRLDAALRMPPR